MRINRLTRFNLIDYGFSPLGALWSVMLFRERLQPVSTKGMAMIVFVADALCEAECPEDGHRIILEMSPWEASSILQELPVEPAFASTNCMVGLLQRALERVPSPEDPSS